MDRGWPVGNIKILARYNFLGQQLELYFYIDDEMTRTRYIARPVKLMFEKYAPSVETLPTVVVPVQNPNEFLKSLVDSISDSFGIKPEQESKLEGILEATKYHLEDMRRLVFGSEDGKV